MMNYYNTLGIENTASAEDIKLAYRKLAMKYHPDRNQNDKAAEEKFKEVSAAYEVLGDENKRKQYDFQLAHGATSHNAAHMNFNEPFEDIINQMFSQAGFHNFRRRPEKNQDLSFNMAISLEDAFNGKQVPLGINTPSGRRVDLMIIIPAGVDHGARIRYQGQGDQRNTSLPPGDLYIQVDILPNQAFQRLGPNLERLIKVDAIDLILGCKQTVECIDSSKIEITIPAGTQHGTKFRIPNKGMPVQPNSKMRGDFFIVILCQIPQKIDSHLANLLAQIRQSNGIDIHV